MGTRTITMWSSVHAGLAACLLAFGWAAGCGGSDDGGARAGTGGSGSTTDAGVSPTRACVLNGTCYSCYDANVCWEGYRQGSCAAGVEQPTSSSQTCPELGFPVNCSGQNRFEPAGTVCRDGGTSTPRLAFGDPCTTTSQCPAGLECMYYYGNAANGRRCLQGCRTHADCSGYTHPDFTGAFTACWSCTTGSSVPDPGEEQCLPLSVCGGGPGVAACDACLSACTGLPSCCTGCGCLCESECGVC